MKQAFVGVTFFIALLYTTCLSMLQFKENEFIIFKHVKTSSIPQAAPLNEYFNDEHLDLISPFDDNLQKFYAPLYQKFRHQKASVLMGLSHPMQTLQTFCFIEEDDSAPHILYVSHSMLTNNSVNRLMRFLKDILCIIKHIDDRDKEIHLYLPLDAQSLKKSLFKKSKRPDSWVCEVVDHDSSECLAKLSAKKLPYK